MFISSTFTGFAIIVYTGASGTNVTSQSGFVAFATISYSPTGVLSVTSALSVIPKSSFTPSIVTAPVSVKFIGFTTVSPYFVVGSSIVTVADFGFIIR